MQWLSDAAVGFVAKAVVEGELGRGFPRVLKVEVVRIAMYVDLIEAV